MENPFVKIQLEFDRISRRLTLIEDFLFEIKHKESTSKITGESILDIAEKARLVSAMDAIKLRLEKINQDNIPKQNDNQKKPRTGTATTSDGIHFKNVKPDK